MSTDMADLERRPGYWSTESEENHSARVVRERVVVIGGGFAGATLAQHLERETSADTEIVVLSRDNHLVFTPMLPEVAGRTLSPLNVVVPGRQMTRRTIWLSAEATGVDFDKRLVRYTLTHGGAACIPYTHLVFACGTMTDLKAVPGMSSHALPLKSVGDAFELGNRLIERFEEATLQGDAAARQRLLTVVVIGGGFNGVETAGHLLDLMQAAHRYYPRLAGETPSLVLLQRGDRLLPELQHPSLSEFTLKKLSQDGVDVRLKTEVEEVTATHVCLKGGERIEHGLVVCAAGTSPVPLLKEVDLPKEKGRLTMTPEMRVQGWEHVWAIGDCAAVPNAHDGKLSPPTAQFALRQARQLARNIGRFRFKVRPEPFRFRPQGLLASIGHRNGVAEVFGFQFSGFLAWLFWRGVYLAKIPGFARKLSVGADWLLDMLSPPNVVLLRPSGAERVRTAHYAAGDYVFRKDEAGDEFYVIEKGKAVAFVDEDGPPLARLQEGDHFGEGALLQPAGQGRHSASVRADSPLDLLVLGRGDFEQLARSLGSMHQDLERSRLLRQAYHGLVSQLQQRPDLCQLRVGDVMDRSAPTLEEGLPLARAVEHFRAGRIGAPVLGSDGALRGYCGITEVCAALARSLGPETPLADFMRPNAPRVSVDLPVLDATLEFLRRDVDTLPVVNGDGATVEGQFSPLVLFRREGALSFVAPPNPTK